MNLQLTVPGTLGVRMESSQGRALAPWELASKPAQQGAGERGWGERVASF